MEIATRANDKATFGASFTPMGKGSLKDIIFGSSIVPQLINEHIHITNIKMPKKATEMEQNN